MPIPSEITNAFADIAIKQVHTTNLTIAQDIIDNSSGERKVGQIITYRNKEHYNNVVLFVHGFAGNAQETFGVTPVLLEQADEFRGWDIYSISYSSDIFPNVGKGLWSANPDITKVSQYLKTLLQNQFSKYHRIAFVAHSMGGLAIQRLILDLDSSIRKKITHTLLFGTPSSGLRKASIVSFWSSQTRDLSRDSVFIKKLRSDWTYAFADGLPFTFKSIAGTKDEFVPTTSSLDPFEEKFRGVIEGNHVSMIKPKDETDTTHQSFQIILKTLTDQQISYLLGDPEEINILLGDYQHIINKFQENASQLSTPNLVMLVFALECNNKKVEALEVLRNHPASKNDSDILGTIGGRFKRKYLLDGLQHDLNSSIDYYLKALELSTINKNNKQIFYHAINLAFLSAISQNDNEMRDYAAIALTNCVSENKDLWEIATIAEANMYLGNLDNAREYYQQAALLAGIDIRAKNSIYLNAMHGYQALMASKNKNAEFIKFLDELFV